MFQTHRSMDANHNDPNAIPDIDAIRKNDDVYQERVQRRFKRWLASDDTKKCLAILKAEFDLHLPSMLVADFNPLKAAYQDGQKSVFTEIDDIVDGKYRSKQTTNEHEDDV